jgi:hypothetical protein
VNNGRGPAMLGDRVLNKQQLPFASFEEHLIFADNLPKIVQLFGELLKKESKRMEAAEENVITETQIVDRIV